MASYQKDRDEFISIMSQEGVRLEVIQDIMRDAQTIQRCATELECSSEAAYNDRVLCPVNLRHSEWCLCRDEGTFETTADGQEHHGDVPRYAVREQQAKARIVRRLAGYAKVVPVFSGDPRGACVKLKVPSGRTNDWGQEGICVPTKEVRRTCSTFRRVRVS